jgi:protein-S-isoprenylcysteine O-methyltransferase Ste14
LHEEIAMRRLCSLLYGVAAYLAGLATLLYLIGFSANLVVPRSVDVGPGAAAPEAVLTDLVLLALFGIQHSAMARRGFKRWWTRVVPPAVERSTYVAATCAVLAVMFRFWVPIDAPVAWRIEQTAGAAVLWTGFAIGWLLVLASTFQIDHLELFGLKQVFARAMKRPAPEPRFVTPLLYRYVRHPLYAGLLLTFWSVPIMTAGRLLFALGCTVYILIGIAFEERDLVARFGERYRAYREQVGMLIPHPGSPRRSTRT